MKICVLGAGSLGCAFGVRLAESGQEVWLVNRSAALVDAVRAQGLKVIDAGGERQVRLNATTRCADVGVADLVIVLVKSFHTREAMEQGRSLVGPDTVVLSLQNGLGHEDVLADVLADAGGRAHVMAGKTYVGGQLVAPGVLSTGVAGKATIIGELDGRLTARAQAIAEAFNAAGLATTVSPDIRGVMWDKLLVNVATGALSGITRLPYGLLYQVPELQATATAAVAEAMAVARAAGVNLRYTDPAQPWRDAGGGLPASFKASMLQSLEKGSVTEVDYINGAVVREGARLGVPTPVNAALVACIKGLERGLEAARPTNKENP